MLKSELTVIQILKIGFASTITNATKRAWCRECLTSMEIFFSKSSTGSNASVAYDKYYLTKNTKMQSTKSRKKVCLYLTIISEKQKTKISLTTVKLKIANCCTTFLLRTIII